MLDPLKETIEWNKLGKFKMNALDFVKNISVAMLLLIYYQRGCSANVPVSQQQQLPQNNYFFNEMQLDKTEKQLKIPKDQTLIVRLPYNTLLKYTSYKDVSILHFHIPPDTQTALFTFKAIEESKSAFQRKCKPRDVTLHLKASSYPVISPENITFPKNFLNADQRYKLYDLQFLSDEKQQRVTVPGPQIGNWFAVAFVSWTDPNNDRIEQQGLAASCDTLLLAEMSVSRINPIIINNGQVHYGNLTSRTDKQKQHQLYQTSSSSDNNITLNVENDNKRLQMLGEQQQEAYEKQTSSGDVTLKEKGPTEQHRTDPTNRSNNDTAAATETEPDTANNENIYKFFVPPDIGVATARIAFAQVCLQCPIVGFYIQANAVPSMSDEHNPQNIHSTVIKPNQTDEISIEFYVQPNTWHYAVLKFVSESSDNVSADPSFKRSARLSAEPKEDAIAQLKTKFKRAQRWIKRQSSTATGSTDEYHIEYSLQIYFELPSNEVNKEKTRANKNSDNATNSNNSSQNSWRPGLFRDMELYPLLRQTYREFFMFDYDLMPDKNDTVPALLNLTAGTPAGFAFDLGEVYDIGGTLSFGLSMKHGQRADKAELKSTVTAPTISERNGILAEKLISEPTNDVEMADSSAIEPSRSNQTIIVCMHLGEPGVPTWPDKCRYGRQLLPASCIVNNTDTNTNTGLVHVPFPESGRWYVTMGLYCHGAETARVTIIDSVKEFVRQHVGLLRRMRAPCACASSARSYESCVHDESCLSAMTETETLKIKECMMDSKCTLNYIEITRQFENHHKMATEQHFALDNCNTSVVFTISSSPCVAGRCGRFGRCYHYMSGGFVFSTCVCMKGYRGWDCTEDSQVPSSMSILLASLLLTLSNLLFLPSIYTALRRKYYTESLIYFFAMFFSIFYHACDSGEDEYSFCLVKIGVLQFCDFYCGLLAIWVTLVAMSHIRQQFVSLLHMFGAILLAFGTELNKQSLWVFLAPALTGICLISASWGMRCYKTRKWFPARRYLTVCMPLGAVLVMIGLVCYAFLQTKQNYHIVHSVWHMVMALSILCLLPSRKSFAPKC